MQSKQLSVEIRINENVVAKQFINVNKDCHIGLMKDRGDSRV